MLMLHGNIKIPMLQPGEVSDKNVGNNYVFNDHYAMVNVSYVAKKAEQWTLCFALMTES